MTAWERRAQAIEHLQASARSLQVITDPWLRRMHAARRADLVFGRMAEPRCVLSKRALPSPHDMRAQRIRHAASCVQDRTDPWMARILAAKLHDERYGN